MTALSRPAYVSTSRCLREVGGKGIAIRGSAHPAIVGVYGLAEIERMSAAIQASVAAFVTGVRN